MNFNNMISSAYRLKKCSKNYDVLAFIGFSSNSIFSCNSITFSRKSIFSNKFMFSHNLTFLRKFIFSCGFIFPVSFALAAENTTSNQLVDDDFGRLFTAQFERNAIDKARLSGGFVPAKVTGINDDSAASSNTVQPAQSIKVLGVLLRADGKNKVWLSGASDTSNNIVNGRSIIGNINQSANVKVGVNNGTILKPGQVWSPLTGRQESYQIPIPKPAISETAIAPVVAKKQPTAAASSSAMSMSSASTSEAQSSVSSSAK
jgi:hypothetical protein